MLNNEATRDANQLDVPPRRVSAGDRINQSGRPSGWRISRTGGQRAGDQPRCEDAMDARFAFMFHRALRFRGGLQGGPATGIDLPSALLMQSRTAIHLMKPSDARKRSARAEASADVAGSGWGIPSSGMPAGVNK